MSCLQAFSQDDIECITIDFESIPNETLFEGLEISEQYRDSFGMYFELETGGVPVLAEVGGFQAAAFASIWGQDTPAPGVDIGQFFLTDDGMLSGLFSPPVIVRFDIPVDTFSGCILDMDLSEIFVIQARDEFDQVILSDTISAGDPGTGDGQLTCWGFNLPQCEGSVYSIRYEGFRTTSGAFGMGLDNLTFCKGVDVSAQISTEATEPDCNDLISATVSIVNEGPGVFQYALNDTSNFQSSPFFSDLPAGDYTLWLLEEKGCLESYPFTIPGPQDVNFSELNVVHTSCDEDNGGFQFVTTIPGPLEYSVDGINYKDSPNFSDLPPGDYTYYVRDTFGCIFQTSGTINPSTAPIIQSITATDDLCGAGAGTITANAQNGTGDFTYSLNDSISQPEGFFANLQAGKYVIRIVDEAGCELKDSLVISPTPPIELSDIAVSQTVCDETIGVLNIAVSGGEGELSYVINGVSYSTSVVTNLGPGSYEVIVEDEAGCFVRSEAIIDVPRCPVWIPNVFSPNGDSQNDLFSIGTVDDYAVDVLYYLIYDRWGELVFESKAFDIRSADNWWDGRFNGEDAETGVYTYLIEVRHENGDFERFAGDVTLLR
jgi:gliding motility-associated-like protein